MINQQQETRRYQLDAMWDVFVAPYVDPDLFAEDRIAAAVWLLTHYETVSRGADIDRDFKLVLLSQAAAVWRLVSAEKMTWFIDTYTELFSETDPNLENAQVHVGTLLNVFDMSLPSTHRNYVDPVALVVPAAIFSELRNSFEALKSGETLDILRPSTSAGRHLAPWTWDQARLRAVQHVAFLCGTGLTKRAAQERVGKALDVGWETLRLWERDLRKGGKVDCLDQASEAGEIAAKMRDNPQGGMSQGGVPPTVDVVTALEQIAKEPLGEFGAWYAESFGYRHNQGGSKTT